MAALLEIRDLDKTFFGVHALKDVSLTVEQGSLLGLVGENGAGKSTLMNIIGGVVPPSRGTMSFLGTPFSPRRPSDATSAGIAFIHQELNLFTNLSIAENLFIDGFPRRFGVIDRGFMRRRTLELLKALDLEVSPNTLVENLSPGERQLVEIAKALHRDARLIIFDEPTTSLTKRETDRLFATIERLRTQGVTMIYISHVLSDVKRIASHVAVLRDGRLVSEGAGGDYDIAGMIQAMIGRELQQLFPPQTRTPTSEPVLEVENLSQPGIVRDISLSVHKGEIVGLFGLMGSGRSELARILFGLDPLAQGTITLNGAPLPRNPAAAIKAGMAFVTENRREEGLMMEAPILENIALVSIKDFAHTPLRVLDFTGMEETARAVSGDLRLRAGDIRRQPAKSLSGGNQQKVVLGKWLLSQPKLFILDEPTRGVDVGAKYEIYTIADRIAAEGNGILFISSELEELMGICDRILVMSHGEIRAAFPGKSYTQEDILRARLPRGDRGMNPKLRDRYLPLLLSLATPLMFLLVLLYFGSQSPAFLSLESLGNIVKQASFIGIAAVGIIFVLLTAGIDLSIGSVMYLAPLLAGFAMQRLGLPVEAALIVAVLCGGLLGAFNAVFIVWLRIIPFIVTLSTLFFFRGFGTFLTSSRQFDFPREVLAFGQSAPFGVPLPIIIFAIVVIIAQFVLSQTQFGRQIYAVGNDPDAARKAGIPVKSVIARVYVISGACAALAGFVLIAQIGRLDQAFGEGREFDVIAAAVLGGASLFGGIGSAWSAVIGATLIQTVKAGMVFAGVGLYVQPMVQGAVIFIAVFFDSLRVAHIQRLRRRNIRSEA